MPEDDFYQTGSSSESSESGGEDAGAETFLAPKSAFKGKELEVGNKCEVEIKSIMGDELELQYVPHKDKDDKSDKKDEGEAEDAAASIDRGIERMRQM